MKKPERTYLPAAGSDWLLPFYDLITKLVGIDSDRKTLIDQSDIQPGQRILDIGCGTGSLLVLIKRFHKDESGRIYGFQKDQPSYCIFCTNHLLPGIFTRQRIEMISKTLLVSTERRLYHNIYRTNFYLSA